MQVLQKENAPNWILSVTVLQGSFHYSQFHEYIWSHPSLYVTLQLSTVSDCTLRTKTIQNSKKPEWNETFYFPTHSQVKNILELNLYYKKSHEPCQKFQFDISTLNLGQKEKKVFNMDAANELKGELWVEFELRESSEKDIKVRMDFGTHTEEEKFLLKRREVVASALQKILNFENPLDRTKAPTVAVVCSGGGTRAMTGMYGSLKGLQSLGLLDVITYMTSVSGSTWTTANLYSDPLWSKLSLDEAINSQKKKLPKSLGDLFSDERRNYYCMKLQDREEEGHSISLIDAWGLIIEQLVFGKEQTATLSGQKKAVSEGQNPLPIYTAVNKKKDESGSNVYEWCEFTPFEVGFSKHGAFVHAEHFGSEFYLGHVIKELQETRISFLLGIWSSVFSIDLKELWKNYVLPYFKPDLSNSRVEELCLGVDEETFMLEGFSTEVTTLFKIISHNTSSMFNFLRGFFLDTSAVPSMLSDPILNLVDSGFAINTAFAPVLQPQRCADIILSLSYSWDKDPLQVIKDTQKYCTDNELPFPKIDFSEHTSQPEKEVYVFKDDCNPDAPIVIHFPLVNVSFKDYKAPGVKRAENEMEDGKIDVSIEHSSYKTKHLIYSEEKFQKLVDLTSYNIANNKETIINALMHKCKNACVENNPVSIPL